MVYRSDTEALEARLQVLEKDLAERTRERDDVATLLADAKATDEARQWLADAPRRRRRRWIAGISLVLAGFAWFATYRIGHPRPDKFEQALKTIAQYTEAACKCVDRSCVEAVNDKLTKWGQQMAQEYREPSKPSEDQMKRMTEVAKRLTECLLRAMQNDPSQSQQNQQSQLAK